MSLSPEQENSASSLYCAEDVSDVASLNVPDLSATTTDSPADGDDDRSIAGLIESELAHMPESDYLHRLFDRSIDVTSRLDAINWILRVHAYYHFRPVTAYLSVNYIDRFLSSCILPYGQQEQQQQGNGWPFQLLSVACLSIAAKMEEIKVPLLLDLQVLEPRFIFEPRTVQRMELLVMTSLKWRMRSVTPFDYIDYFIAKLPPCFASQCTLPSRVFSFASDLILNTSRVIDFLGYPPSTIAAAAVLCAAGGSVDLPAGDDRKTVSFYDRLSKEMVRSCHQLMEDYLIDTCPSARHKHRRTETAPASPVGVLDAAACGSCDTQKSASLDLPEPSQAETPNKRQKLPAAADVQRASDNR